MIMIMPRVALLCVAAAFAFAEEKHVDYKWSYSASPAGGCKGGDAGECGPEEWHTIKGFESCSKEGIQSPIDMLVSSPTDIASKGFEFTNKGMCEDELIYELNAHTSEVVIKSTKCGPYETKWNGNQYKLLQFHYHSPSENTWEGKHFPMEMHYVHKCVDCADEEYVVLALMIAVGADKDANDFLANTLSHTPKADPSKNDNNYEESEKIKARPYHAFRGTDVDATQYYFEGSMTTPNCLPGAVHWVMASKPMLVKEADLHAYRHQINAEPTDVTQVDNYVCGAGKGIPEFHETAGMSGVKWDPTLGCNNRPVQPLHAAASPDTGRVLYKTQPSGGASDGGGGVNALDVVLIVIGLLAAVGAGYYFCTKFALGRELAGKVIHVRPLLG